MSRLKLFVLGPFALADERAVEIAGAPQKTAAQYAFFAMIETLRMRVAPPVAHLFHSDPEFDPIYERSGALELARIGVAASNSFG